MSTTAPHPTAHGGGTRPPEPRPPEPRPPSFKPAEQLPTLRLILARYLRG